MSWNFFLKCSTWCIYNQHHYPLRFTSSLVVHAMTVLVPKLPLGTYSFPQIFTARHRSRRDPSPRHRRWKTPGSTPAEEPLLSASVAQGAISARHQPECYWIALIEYRAWGEVSCIFQAETKKRKPLKTITAIDPLSEKTHTHTHTHALSLGNVQNYSYSNSSPPLKEISYLNCCWLLQLQYSLILKEGEGD